MHMRGWWRGVYWNIYQHRGACNLALRHRRRCGDGWIGSGRWGDGWIDRGERRDGRIFSSFGLCRVSRVNKLVGIINSYLGEFDFFLEGCNAFFFGSNLSADIGRIVGTHGYIGGGSNRRRLLPQRRTGYICTGGKGFGKAKAGPFLLRRCRRICCLGDVPLEKRLLLLLLIIRSHRSEGRWYAICRGHDSCLLGSVSCNISDLTSFAVLSLFHFPLLLASLLLFLFSPAYPEKRRNTFRRANLWTPIPKALRRLLLGPVVADVLPDLSIWITRVASCFDFLNL